jgi:hypothetical protein
MSAISAIHSRRTQKRLGLLTGLSALAGLLYCSWPLGYDLNPIANRGLASNLEATGQPYSWLFINLDIVSGLMVCLVAWFLYRWQSERQRSWWLLASLVGFVSFGALTIVDALLPLDCNARLQACVPNLQDPYFIIHGAVSIGSTNGLTLSIVALWWLLIRDPRTGAWMRWLLHSTLALWLAFGLGTAFLIYENRSSADSQHVFIVICSLWTAALPYLVLRALQLQSARRRTNVS